MSQPGPDRFRVQGPTPPSVERATAPLYELTAAQSRALDQRAVDDYGIPSIVLMENAAIGLHAHAMRLLANEPSPSVIICCGPGNNGGDGFALARHLHNSGVEVRVITTQNDDDYKGDAAINLSIVRRMGIEIIYSSAVLEVDHGLQATLIVDSIFGTGLSRAIEGDTGDLIELINAERQRQHANSVMSVDLPSGIDADRGEVLGERVVRADITVTLAGLKPCMSRVEAHQYLGEVHVASIGVPRELIAAIGEPIVALHRD